jgi:hypothetical protein
MRNQSHVQVRNQARDGHWKMDDHVHADRPQGLLSSTGLSVPSRGTIYS